MTEGLKYKVCLLGDKAVGKTSVIKRFVFNVYDDRYISTIGTNVDKKELKVDGEDVTLIVWDILGEEGFENLRSAYYKGSRGAIFVCDSTRKETLESMDDWLGSLFKVAGKVPVVLFSNKWDLKEKIVTEGDLKHFADKYDSIFLQTSAKTGDNVEKGFEELARGIIQSN